MRFRTKLKKAPILSVFSFITTLIISNATPHSCLADEPLGTTIDPTPWTTIEPIPTPIEIPNPAPKPTPELPEPPPPQPPLPPPTPSQLGSCFKGCRPSDQNCKMKCFQEWQKAGGR